MIKVKSKTDVITNSSSETFAVIKGPGLGSLKALEKELNDIGDFRDCCGDGGIYLEDEPVGEEKILISYSYQDSGSGAIGFAKYGLKKFIEARPQFTIEFLDDEG